MIPNNTVAIPQWIRQFVTIIKDRCEHGIRLDCKNITNVLLHYHNNTVSTEQMDSLATEQSDRLALISVLNTFSLVSVGLQW